jgi:hypothetical protein
VTAIRGESGGLRDSAGSDRRADDVLDVYVQLAAARVEIRHLKQTLRVTRLQRDRWRAESKAWKWGALHKGRK